jgi:flagellar protein FliL
MAENAPQEKSGEAAPAKKPKSKMLFIIIGAVVVVAGAVAVLFFTGVLGHGHKASSEAEEVLTSAGEGKEGKEGPKQRPTVPLKEFVVNLADAEAPRYLKVVMELEVTNVNIGNLCQANQAAIRNSLVELLSSKTFAEIRDMKGKAKLRQEIIVRINEILGANGVTQVFFTEFIVQ